MKHFVVDATIKILLNIFCAKNTVLFVIVTDLGMNVLIYMHKRSFPCVLCNWLHTNCHFLEFYLTGLTETHIAFECYAIGPIVTFNFLHDDTN